MSNVQPLSPELPSTAILNINAASANAAITQTTPVLASTVQSINCNTYSRTNIVTSDVVTTLMSQQAAMTSGLTEQEKLASGIVGTIGVSFNQLSSPGQCMKPGSGEFVKDLITANPNVPLEKNASAIVYSGDSGVTDSQSLNNNISAQTKAFNDSIQKANTDLITEGVISGNENSTQTTGIILASAMVGVAAVKSFVSSGASSISSGISSLVASGNFASSLADKLKSGSQGLSSSLEGLKDKFSDLGFNIKNLNLFGTKQQAFLVAEQSFGELKANVPNVLGGGESAATESATGVVKTVLDYSTAKEELLYAEKLLLQAESNYNNEPSETNLNAIRSAEEKVSRAKQKLAQLETNTVNEAKSFASTISSELSSQVAAPLANSSNTGINALPGGLGALANTISSSVSSSLSSVKSLIDGSQSSGSLNEKISSSLKSLSNSIGDKFSSIKTNLAASVSKFKSSLSSIGSQDGQVKTSTLADDTYKETKEVVNSVVGATLDPRVPLPVFNEMVSSAPPELQMLVKTSSQKTIEQLKAKREEKALLLDTLITENTLDPTDQTTKSIDDVRKELSLLDQQIALTQRVFVGSSA